MTSQIDFKYLIEFLNFVDKSNSEKEYFGALKLLRESVSILTKDFSLMPGYCKDNENRRLLNQYFFPILPGIDNTTWCTYFVFRMMLIMCEEKALYICDQTEKIGYTTADEMVNAVIKCSRTNILRKLSWQQAQAEANQGKLVIVAADGLFDEISFRKNSGHVAIVCPAYHPVNGLSDMFVIQAGVINGIVALTWAFALGGGIVQAPQFYGI